MESVVNKTNTYEIIVKGLVQGIGYRPFVARLAEQHGLSGQVQNTAGIVTIKINAQEADFLQFLSELKESAPIGAKVEEITWTVGKPQYFSDFSIGKSAERIGVSGEDARRGISGVPYIPADLPTCENCIRELFESKNRRFRHPFISCVNCGPRYSIIEKLPYDRESITMKDFPLCKECEHEYTKKADIRRHAQTIACKECGPRLMFTEIRQSDNKQNDNKQNDENVLQRAIECLHSGGIVAIKDIGGYHLACLPGNETAVHILREMKHRQTKPFAVLFRDIESVRQYCEVSRQEAEALNSPPRPIVLLRRKPAMDKEILKWSDEVCNNSPYIGAMLCCNPVQVLLTDALGELVMTSANASGDLMIIDDEQMRLWMQESINGFSNYDGNFGFVGKNSNIANDIHIGILFHNRKILTPLDDSVVRIVAGKRILVRRARGFVPEPVSCSISQPVFAAGGDLKACFCFSVPGKAYLSQPFGDLEEEAVFLQYQNEVGRMKQLFGFHPKESACDLHPEYRSRTAALEFHKGYHPPALELECAAKNRCYQVQHHQAHVASVIAEHHLSGTVIGVAFDGTGYGTDGSIWGSEFFLWEVQKENSSERKNSRCLEKDTDCPIDRESQTSNCKSIKLSGTEQFMKRIGHLKPVRLPGGDAGARNTDGILYAYLASLPKNVQDFYIEKMQDFPWMNAAQFEISQKAAALGVNRIASSSMGRLFDAVSALLGVCHFNSYEGEAPIELEYLAESAKEEYPLSIITCQDADDCYAGDTSELFLEIGKAFVQKIPVNQIARGFIRAVSDWIVDMVSKIWDNNYIGSESPKVVLSGGTFLNALLLSMVIPALKAKGFCPYINEQVPPSDGGLALGQAYLAGQLHMSE